MTFVPTPLQTEPPQFASDDRPFWLMVADRGAGATRAGAETVAKWARETPGTEILVASPSGSLRWCFEGPAGLVARFENDEIKSYDRRSALLSLQNGSRMRGTVPSDLRGRSADRAWASDLHLWGRESFDQLWFCLRGSSDMLIVGNTMREGMQPWVMDLIFAAHKPESPLCLTSS